MAFTIRTAVEADVGLVLGFIKELAEYEKLSHAVTATEELLKESLFGPRPAAEVVLAYEGSTEIGFALFFHNFSTFLSKKGLYLEDLYIREAYRRKGYGRRLLRHLAKIAVDRNCGRFEWAALDWNTPAINFYRGLGAISMDDWTTFRLIGAPLQTLANEKDE